MNVLTGPRSTPEQLGNLTELSGLTGLPLLHDTGVIELLDADAVFCAAGWECCPLATADVDVAGAYGLAVKNI